jgi:hypothetical protein
MGRPHAVVTRTTRQAPTAGALVLALRVVRQALRAQRTCRSTPAIDRDAWRSSGITSIIEEEIQARLTRMLRFSARVLDHIDGAQRLTHVAVVVAMRGVGHMPWRTREEQQRSPNAATMSMRSTEHVEVTLSPPVRRRAALLHDMHALAEDFVVRLRREVRG